MTWFMLPPARQGDRDSRAYVASFFDRSSGWRDECRPAKTCRRAAVGNRSCTTRIEAIADFHLNEVSRFSAKTSVTPIGAFLQVSLTLGVMLLRQKFQKH
jgi:hypothetical protein